MNSYIIIFLIVILIIFLLVFKKDNKEHFETYQSDNYILTTRLNNKALQLYKGTIDTSLVVNTTKQNYYPQLWKYVDNYLISVYNNKYLTVSSDKTKVLLDNLDKNKNQRWKLTNKGYFVLENDENLGLYIEGANTSEDAMVVLDKPQDKNEFKWTLTKVDIKVVSKTIMKDQWDCRKEKTITASNIPETSTFSYSLWFNLKGDSFMKNEWKTVFLRGSRDTRQRTPSIFIRPSENRFHIRASTSKDWNEGIDTSKFNIELDTWYYLTLVYTERQISFYVNGQLSDTLNLVGTLIHKGDFHLGKCDCIVSNIEYTNKPLNTNEIIKRMDETNPESKCKETREITIIKNNLVPSIDSWKSAVKKIIKNLECPAKKLGGNTVTFNIVKEAKLETSVKLLENQYYSVSVWIKSNNDTNIRPFTGSGEWKGEWKTYPFEKTSKKNRDYVEYKWDFLNISKNDKIGFELTTKDESKTTLFLPIVLPKIIRVDDGNITVKEYRSNGTHSTCEIRQVDLNSRQGWCALKAEREKYYLEADLDKLYNIKKIHTRGRGDYPQWVTEYKIEYFDIYYNKWMFLDSPSILNGNSDMNTLKTNDVDITTNKIRIYPVSFQGWPSMRIGFTGLAAKKDKCMEYKIRSETEENLLEREKYLELYNKECKKINYYTYQKELDRERTIIDNLTNKLKRAEIDSQTYESKYNEAMANIKSLEKEIEKLNIEKEIIANNSSMSGVKLNEKCEPIGEVNVNLNTSKKTKKTYKKSLDKAKTMDDLLQEIQQLNKDLEKKSAKIEEIESELKLLQSTGVPKDNKKKKLVKQKKTTEKEIETLKKQLEECQAQFEGFANFNEESAGDIILVNGEIRTNPNISKRYDIRHHKQYKQLLKEIQDKLVADKKAMKQKVSKVSEWIPQGKETSPRELKETRDRDRDNGWHLEILDDSLNKCKPFSTVDIRTHKDYPKVIQAIYSIAKKELKGDISSHKDYNKLVREIETRTMRAYGRKTDKGYMRCPDNCELLNEVDIENHPKFRSMMRDAIKKVIAKYGKPIPGTNPTLYRPCLENNLSNNNSNMNSKCLQNFTSSIEHFESVPLQSGQAGQAGQAGQCATAPQEPSAMPAAFDIRYHKQYPELVKKLTEKCATAPSVEQIEKLKAECSMQLNNVDISKNPQYQKLLAAYNKLSTAQKPGGDLDKLKQAYEKLKQEQAKCNESALAGQFDITRHPDINKYVLKSSLPIDLSVKSVYEDQIKLLKSELEKLHSIHDKCQARFNLNVREGFTSDMNTTTANINLKDSKDAKILVEKINTLIAKLDKNLSIQDKSQFEEIKTACRTAFNFADYMDKSTRKFIQSVYDDILSVEKREKRLEEIVNKYIHSKQIDTPIKQDLAKMVQLEANKQSNEATIEAVKKDIQKTIEKVDAKQEAALDTSKQAIDNVTSKLMTNSITNPKEEAEYLRSVRKYLENEKDNVEMSQRELRMKYDKLKQIANDLDFKNNYMRNELEVLKKRCNERIMKLWEENSNIRKSLENREKQTRTRESTLDKRLKDIEEREERLNVSKGSQLERYQYLQNKIQQERSVADKYKEELNRLRDSIEKQKVQFDNKQFEMNNEISRVKDECTARVDRYRRMYEEGEKLLDELRIRSLKSPELVPKIDQVEQRMNTKVQEAIKNTVELQKSPNPTTVQQTTIDNKLLEDMKKLIGKVDDIEKKLKSSNAESAHWYNNKYAVV
jgi:hypothetical protein